MTLLYVSLAILLSNFLGGFFALKFRDKLHLILGFSAGTILGVAFFDLLPESFEIIGESFGTAFAGMMIGIGFVFFMLIERFISINSHCEEGCESETHKGRLGAFSLSIHSFFDGLVVGLAFQASFAVGFVVAIAIITHKFSDGLNTVSLILRDGGERKSAIKWLIFNSLAPILGIIISLFVFLPEAYLGIILAIFCGFFIYIGASDLLPESHHRHPTYLTTFATVFGIIFVYFVAKFAGI